jgi:hypothetical protein
MRDNRFHIKVLFSILILNTENSSSIVMSVWDLRSRNSKFPLNQNEENSLDFHLSIPATCHEIACVESDLLADCSSLYSVNVCLSIVSGLAFPESGRAFIAQNASTTNTDARERGFARVTLPLSLRFWTCHQPKQNALQSGLTSDDTPASFGITDT